MEEASGDNNSAASLGYVVGFLHGKLSYASVIWRPIGVESKQCQRKVDQEADRWVSSPAMFNFDAPTVFKTHATVLGRALSNSDFDLLGAVEEGHIDDSLAEDYGLKSKHQLKTPEIGLKAE